ncbi:MAG: BRO family protein [Bosea sp. (in: a-proteobacteria)]
MARRQGCLRGARACQQSAGDFSAGDDEKHTVSNLDGIAADNRAQEIALISFPGAYRLILKSRKPQAKLFQRRLVHEVLLASCIAGG